MITEAEPGRQLDDTYLEPAGVATRLFVQPTAESQQSKVTITTEGPTQADGMAGWLEQLIAAVYLRRTFRKELDLLTMLAK